MNVLLIYAHPEQQSFNAALKQTAIDTLSKQGHAVEVSDLYAMNFKTTLDREDFLSLTETNHVNYVTELKAAYMNNALVEEIRKEQEKVRRADFLLFQYPLWWFSVPAILKGWFDRVLTTGFAWDFGRLYDKGLLAGKKGMVSVTTGGPENFYAEDAPHGWSIEQVLYPINHGVLYFCGITPVEPFAAFSVFQVDNEVRKKYLEDFRKRLLSLETTKTLHYHPLSDYDEQMRLKVNK
ncbi:MAG: NAD(P)H-dependent oxidoreductase [Nitrospirae bacterium]|nr:NAD(P)H-dependent oxidoreductase [Nitrospirota bacterium]